MLVPRAKAKEKAMARTRVLAKDRTRVRAKAKIGTKGPTKAAAKARAKAAKAKTRNQMFSIPLNPKLDRKQFEEFYQFLIDHKSLIYDVYITTRIPPFDQDAMGVLADLCALEHQITREEQDDFAMKSYLRSKKAWEEGKFKEEVIPVEIPQRKGETILMTEDEEFKKLITPNDKVLTSH